MKVLIALDNSDCSALAMHRVLNSYWPYSTEFEIMTVIPPDKEHMALGSCYLDSMYVSECERNRSTRKFIDDQTTLLKDKFPLNRITGKIYQGDIAQNIIDAAHAWDADMVVLGSHGRTGLEKVFLGSVAEKVTQHVSCSVEIVKDKNKIKKSSPALSA